MVPVLFDVSPVNPPVHPKVEAGLFSENTKKVGPGIKGVRRVFAVWQGFVSNQRQTCYNDDDLIEGKSYRLERPDLQLATLLKTEH